MLNDVTCFKIIIYILKKTIVTKFFLGDDIHTSLSSIQTPFKKNGQSN
jgi:hypothetical protein